MNATQELGHPLCLRESYNKSMDMLQKQDSCVSHLVAAEHALNSCSIDAFIVSLNFQHFSALDGWMDGWMDG